jgi:hypothetical protein
MVLGYRKRASRLDIGGEIASFLATRYKPGRRRGMSLAVITRLDAGQDLWRLAFYERDGERLHFRSRVTCCWESVRTILRIRELDHARWLSE